MNEANSTSETAQQAPQPIVRRANGARKLLAVLLALIIFVCGGATGFGVAMLHRRPPPPPPGIGVFREPPIDDLVGRLRDELLLSDDQVKQVRQIYEDSRQSLDKIRDQMAPRIKAEFDKLDTQMKGVLNPMQYQRWSDRFHSVRDQMIRPGPPGFGRGPGGLMGSGGPDGGPGGPDRGPGPDGGPDRSPMGGPPGGPPPPGGMPPG